VCRYTGIDQFIRGYDAFISFAVLGNNTTKEAINALLAETEELENTDSLQANWKEQKRTYSMKRNRPPKKKTKRNLRFLFQIISTIFSKATRFQALRQV
jgi:hypothetical protein